MTLSLFQAPPNCLQYHHEIVGKVVSFNFDLYNEGNTYFNNMDYTICFRKEPGFCTLTYSVPTERDPDDDNDLTKPTRPGTAIRYFEIDPESKVVDGPGVGILKCPSDYLLLGGIRYCGGRLNSHIFSPNPQGDTEVTGKMTIDKTTLSDILTQIVTIILIQIIVQGRFSLVL